MDTLQFPDIKEITQVVQYRPSISIILPMQTRINRKTEVYHSLKAAADKVQRMLADKYPGEIGEVVMKKLRDLISGLEFDPQKKSIAIFVSPLFEKVYFLDIPVQETVLVDDSFEIRDLVYSKKQLNKYLLLVLGGKKVRLFLGSNSRLTKVASELPESIHEFENDIAERVANFSDMSERKEILMEKFLRHIDDGLDKVLNVYPLPIFVTGTKRNLGHFKNLSRHSRSIVDYIPGNYERSTEQELSGILMPYLQVWQQATQKKLIQRLEEAAGNNRLSTGINEVWKEVRNQRGRLLVVSKGYSYPAQKNETGSGKTETFDRFSNLTDAVDDLIELVLANGGEVEFADKDDMKPYGDIALIRWS